MTYIPFAHSTTEDKGWWLLLGGAWRRVGGDDDGSGDEVAEMVWRCRGWCYDGRGGDDDVATVEEGGCRSDVVAAGQKSAGGWPDNGGAAPEKFVEREGACVCRVL
ncbi:hypothetical protein Tco_1503070 [Tanacetum coccineum]